MSLIFLQRDSIKQAIKNLFQRDVYENYALKLVNKAFGLEIASLKGFCDVGAILKCVWMLG